MRFNLCWAAQRSTSSPMGELGVIGKMKAVSFSRYAACATAQFPSTHFCSVTYVFFLGGTVVVSAAMVMLASLLLLKSSILLVPTIEWLLSCFALFFDFYERSFSKAVMFFNLLSCESFSFFGTTLVVNSQQHKGHKASSSRCHPLSKKRTFGFFGFQEKDL